MNSQQQLNQIKQELASKGVETKVVKLKSSIKRDRKSLYGVKKSASRRHCGKTQLQNTLYWTSY